MYRLILEKIKDKNIAILGFGREGKSTYKFIRKYFTDMKLTILDKYSIELDDKLIFKKEMIKEIYRQS